MFVDYTASALKLLERASDIAHNFRQPRVNVNHLIMALASDEGLAEYSLVASGIQPEQLVSSIERAAQRGESTLDNQPIGLMGYDVKDVLSIARNRADEMEDELLDVEHIFIALLASASDSYGLALLRSAGLTYEKLLLALNLVKHVGYRVIRMVHEAVYEGDELVLSLPSGAQVRVGTSELRGLTEPLVFDGGPGEIRIHIPQPA